jgi:hypothetical protein
MSSKPTSWELGILLTITLHWPTSQYESRWAEDGITLHVGCDPWLKDRVRLLPLCLRSRRKRKVGVVSIHNAFPLSICLLLPDLD